jgi:ribosomal protein S18 acetylase RimI-like enzyme
MEELEIRGARPGDEEDCFRIEDISYDGHGASLEKIGKRILEYPQGFLVAVAGGRVAGFVNGGSFESDDIRSEKLKWLEGHDPAAPHLVIFSLAVDPDYRGKGISRLLMKRYLQFARESGKTSVLLICREHLLGYYRSFGFRFRADSESDFGGHRWHEMALILKDA